MQRIIIRTERDGVVLKQLVPGDAQPYFQLLNKDRDHLSQHDDVTARKYPDEESVLRSITEPSNPKKLRFGIWDMDVFVGMLGLTPLRKGVCETGGWTGKAYCRLGYASVTRRALAAYAISHLGFQRVIAKSHPGNLPSQGMLKKAGFKLVRRTRESYYFAYTG